MKSLVTEVVTTEVEAGKVTVEVAVAVVYLVSVSLTVLVE